MLAGTELRTVSQSRGIVVVFLLVTITLDSKYALPWESGAASQLRDKLAAP